jgi:hypothetical protein
VLDGAIWKLRDPSVGGVLLGGAPAPPAADPPRPLPALVTGGLVLAGLFSVACWVAVTWEKEVGHRRALAAADLGRVRLAGERLRFLGRDGPRLRNAIGRLEERRGQTGAAAVEYQRSLALSPTAAAWAGLGRIADRRGDRVAAREAYAAALALDPGRASLRRRLEQLEAAQATAGSSAQAAGVSAAPPSARR